MARILGRLLASAAVVLLLTCNNEGPPTPVASVTVTPPAATIAVGVIVQLTATTRDANAKALTGRTVSWTSSNTAVATVSSTGLVTGVAPGSSTITATSEGQSGTAALTVLLPVASATVTPPTTTVLVRQTAQLTATTTDANGNVLTAGLVTCASSHPPLATVPST